MEILNMTPHPLRLCLPDGAARTLAPSGTVVRVAETRTPDGEIGGIPVERVSLGEVEGLPEPREGVCLVVSALAAAACPGRKDVFSPGAPVRDAEGVIIGARGLVRRA